LIAVADTAVNKPVIKYPQEAPKVAVDELEQFFINYNCMHGREFKPIGRRGSRAAECLLKAGMRAHREAPESS
jgi:hypothetical protein